MNIITSYVCIYTVCIYICIYNIYRVFYFSSFSFRHFPVPSGVSQAVNFEVAAIGSTLNTATFVGSFSAGHALRWWENRQFYGDLSDIHCDSATNASGLKADHHGIRVPAGVMWGITIPQRAGHASVALIGAIGVSIGLASLSMVAWPCSFWYENLGLFILLRWFWPPNMREI